VSSETESGFNKDTTTGTLVVAAVLCLVCSLAVSSLAVGLRPRIEANKQLYVQTNVLKALGRVEPTEKPTAADVAQKFATVERFAVNLDRQKGIEAGTLAQKAETYDPRKAAKDPNEGIDIPAELDIAKNRRREKVGLIYIQRGDAGIEAIAIPIYGKGLWSTLYGFIALEADGRTVKGITFYEHAETPGLGGEVENESWKAKWHGKIAINEQGVPDIDVVKGTASGDTQVDGLSGATITSVGVENLVN